MIYAFGDYELDTERYALYRSGQSLSIQPKVLELLAYLIQHQGRVVSKAALIDALWEEPFVSDWALSYCIKAARQTIDDSGRTPRFIKTVRARGYCFIAPVEQRDASAAPLVANRRGAAPPEGGMPVALDALPSVSAERWPPPSLHAFAPVSRAHYEAIAQLLKKGDVIPFLGPGIIEPSFADHPPVNEALAQRLAQNAGFDSGGEPVNLIAQKIQLVAGRGVLYENLREIYQPEPYAYRPGLIHRFLALLNQPLLILSTAHDSLLEDAFDAVDKKYAVVTHVLYANRSTDRGKIAVQYSDQKGKVQCYSAKSLMIDLSKWSVIYKLHGAFGAGDEDDAEEIDSIVASEEDYLALITLLENPLTTIPNYLARHFKKRMFLFLGYAMNDWTDRSMVNVIQRKGNFRRIQPYAIRQAATELEYLYWESKRVRLLELELPVFIRELASTMEIEL